MIEEDSKALNMILEDICNRANATHVFAIDSDGLPISAYSQSGYFDFELSSHIAGLVAAAFETVSELGYAINHGEVDFNYVMFSNGIMIGKKFKNMILIIFLSEMNLEIQKIYEILCEHGNQIEALLPALCIIEEAVQPDDLKNIFSSEASNFDPENFK